LTSRFSPRAVLFEGWRIVRLQPMDLPRGACSSCVRPVLASSRVDLPRCESFVVVCLSDHPYRGVGPSVGGPDCLPGDRGQSARHQLLADHPRTRQDRPLFKVRYWRFYCLFRTVRLRVADCPPSACGLSAPTLRTVRLVICRTSKSFAY
jgi:hypothetical protein